MINAVIMGNQPKRNTTIYDIILSKSQFVIFFKEQQNLSNSLLKSILSCLGISVNIINTNLR